MNKIAGIYILLSLFTLSACGPNENNSSVEPQEVEIPQNEEDQQYPELEGKPSFFKIDTNRRNMRIKRREERMKRKQDSIQALGQ